MPNELNGFDARERNLVNNLLERLSIPGFRYLNKVLHNYSDGDYSYILLAEPGTNTNSSTGTLPTDMTPRLEPAGMIVRESKDIFSFTPAAFTWYQHGVTPSAESIQRMIGEEMFQRYREYQRTRIRQDQIIDVAELLERTGLTRDHYVINARILTGLGIAKQGPFTEHTLETGGLLLTEPRGLGWANSGFPLAADAGTTTVVVNLRLEIRLTIEQIPQLPIDDELKTKLEIALGRLDREQDNENPSYGPIKDLLEMAASSAQLFPVILPILMKAMEMVDKVPIA